MQASFSSVDWAKHSLPNLRCYKTMTTIAADIAAHINTAITPHHGDALLAFSHDRVF